VLGAAVALEKNQFQRKRPNTSMNEDVLQEQNEDALPWIGRSGWRERPLYRGWEVEDILTTVGDRVAVTRSHYGYRVLNTPDVGFVDIDFNPDYDTMPQEKESLARVREWVAQHPIRWAV
jgi:hypothetical protein